MMPTEKELQATLHVECSNAREMIALLEARLSRFETAAAGIKELFAPSDD